MPSVSCSPFQAHRFSFDHRGMGHLTRILGTRIFPADLGPGAHRHALDRRNRFVNERQRNPAVKAALIEQIGQPYVIEDVTLSEPIGQEVLVDVKGSGLCHSDLHLSDNDYGMPLPLLAGHEVAGIVSQVGPDVKSLKPGDHVVACVVYACGYCDRCRVGVPTQCRNVAEGERAPGAPAKVTLGDTTVMPLMGTGGFAEQALIHENRLVAIDKRVPFDRAALLGCAVVTGVGAAINAAKVQPGHTVVVIGCGGVGLNVVQGAAIAGARRIIAIDMQPAKLDLAKKFGATDVVNPTDGDPVAAVKALTQGRGVDHAFEVIGLMPTLRQAIDMLDLGGTAYVVGMQKPGAELAVNVDAMSPTGLLMTGIGVRGIMMGSTNFKIDIPFYADLYLQGRLNLDDLLAETIPLEDINNGYTKLRSGELARSVVVFD
jgi:S-(hydroxymethyl)glutathione dehydrogenase/alcohol dehydrogenase